MKNYFLLLTIAFVTLLVSTVVTHASPLKNEALEAHNHVRAIDKQKPLIWSLELEKISQNWANKLASNCEFYHRPGILPFGENIFYSSTSASISSAVKFWASEKEYYNYEENSCQSEKSCGHYTQLVWKDTTEVGCGTKSCSNGAQIYVCSYFPLGNFNGIKPF